MTIKNFSNSFCVHTHIQTDICPFIDCSLHWSFCRISIHPGIATINARSWLVYFVEAQTGLYFNIVIDHFLNVWLEDAKQIQCTNGVFVFTSLFLVKTYFTCDVFDSICQEHSDCMSQYCVLVEEIAFLRSRALLESSLLDSSTCPGQILFSQPVKNSHHSSLVIKSVDCRVEIDIAWLHSGDVVWSSCLISHFSHVTVVQLTASELWYDIKLRCTWQTSRDDCMLRL